ncbi:MAG: diacylglycerol kinase [Spirochaetes bacterium]|nr:diacylglycerol kinase [Spirochaetota bacterium]
MNFDFFFQSLEEICGGSFVSPGRPLRVAVIANPRAGGFSISSRRKKHLKTLQEYREKSAANPKREMYGKNRLFLTDGKGAGKKAALQLIEEAAGNEEPFYLVITASGDGTCHEVLSAVYGAAPHVRSNMAALRLPMGTGNDGTCSNNLAGALELLMNPVSLFYAPALRLTTAAGGPLSAQHGGKATFLAFNILSVGADAFVTHMTNKMKGRLPGDSYKLWVDIAAVFYDILYKIDYFDLRALDDQNREVLSFRERLLLLAMGASGHRTYGAGKRILPDERNVCAVKQTHLFQKLVLKKLLMQGRLPESPNSINFSARRIEFSTKGPILAQTDGETVLLQDGDFPASIELTAPVIPLLKML